MKDYLHSYVTNEGFWVGILEHKRCCFLGEQTTTITTTTTMRP
jgi:hypothetical protein